MPKYKVYSSQIVYHVLEVEANNKEEAEEIAFNSFEEWKEYQLGDWQIETEHTREVKP